MKMQIAIATLFFCFVSCAPAGFVVDQSRLFGEDPDSPLVTVMRRRTFAGGGAPVRLYLDGELIAYLGSGDYLEFQVRPGEHYLEMTYIELIIKKETTEGVIHFNAKAKGKYYYYFNWGIFKGLTPEEAKRELSTHRYELITERITRGQ